jgi:hypothetical protein
MRRNERKIIETTDNTETQITPEAKTEDLTPSITLSEEQETAFIKAVKIGFYKDFYKQGLITASQLEMLIAMQDQPNHNNVA